MSLRVYRATCMVFITTTPAIMDSKQVLLANSHSLGPRLYLFVILGVTSLNLYHLLGVNQHFSGDSADLLFPVAMSLQATPSLLISALPPLAAANLSLREFSEALRRAQEDTMDETSHVLFSIALPIQVCFLQLQPTPPKRTEASHTIPSLAPQLFPHTQPHCKYCK